MDSQLKEKGISAKKHPQLDHPGKFSVNSSQLPPAEHADSHHHMLQLPPLYAPVILLHIAKPHEQCISFARPFHVFCPLPSSIFPFDYC